MLASPFFSFIIPVYNVEVYLEECIESILNQSFTNFEIILINDESNDGSLAICNYYKTNDKRVKVIDGKKRGVSEARNKGLDLSQGKYIIFLDGDDHLEKTGQALSNIYNILIEDDVDIFLFHLSPFTINNKSEYSLYEIPKTKKIKATKNLSKIFDRRLYLASPCNKIVKKELIDNNNIRFPKGLLCEDIKWCGDLLQHTHNVLFYPISFYFYRKNRVGSTTYKNSKKNINDTVIQLQEHFKLVAKSDKYVNEFYAFYYLSCLDQMIRFEEFSLKEIIIIMKPMKSYLEMSNEKRIRAFKMASRLIGFNTSVRSLIFLSGRI